MIPQSIGALPPAALEISQLTRQSPGERHIISATKH
jgi:hypothetical protein